MCVTCFTADLHPTHAMGSIQLLLDQAFVNWFGKTRPTTARIKFIGGHKQGLACRNVYIYLPGAHPNTHFEKAAPSHFSG